MWSCDVSWGSRACLCCFVSSAECEHVTGLRRFWLLCLSHLAELGVAVSLCVSHIGLLCVQWKAGATKKPDYCYIGRVLSPFTAVLRSSSPRFVLLLTTICSLIVHHTTWAAVCCSGGSVFMWPDRVFTRFFSKRKLYGQCWGVGGGWWWYFTCESDLIFSSCSFTNDIDCLL